MDKKDLEEINKWKKQKMNYIETYGVDIFNEKEKKRGRRILEKLFKLLYGIAKAILIILIFVIIIGTFAVLFMKYQEIENKLHVDPVETISLMYNKNVKVVSRDIDEDKNGTYILTTKENEEIRFYAVVNWNSLTQDYSDRCQKYYYEKWQNDNKNLINVSEYINDNKILEYEQYIKIDKYEQIEEAVSLLCEFKEFAGKDFFPDWNIYLIVNNQRMYPFTSLNENKENVIKKMQEMYNKIISGEIEEPKKNPITEFWGY